MQAGPMTSGRSIRKRRRRNRRPVGGCSRNPNESLVNRKRRRDPVPAPAHQQTFAAMDLLFGRRKTPEELLRQNQRALNRAMRELDRERQKLETQEKKIIADIKKMAKQGQMDAVRIMAKDLVRTRRYVRKFVLMRANIQAVSLKIQTLKSNNSMAQAMKGVTKAMGTMNRQLKLPQIQKIMMEFERQAEIMDMKEEMMNDAIDDAMGDEEDEEESDAVVSQVLDELGLSLTDELSNLPSTGGSLSVAASGKKAEAAASASALVDADADLEERLKNLRRD
ncbi:charged multivesicular body protein 2a isoform X2 [Saccopteryx leptura]|uniref:charged multivesicular body protein 2a isoform X2 n=1 Tax=Saccopteryx leptura TaxID=249018 RepID=UPI00339C4865